MLIAIDKDKNRVKAISYKSSHEIRLQYPLGALKCQFCEQTLFPRERKGFVLHFVHQHPCTSMAAKHPESPEHEEGKLQLVKMFHEQFKTDPTTPVTVEVEHYLPHCGQYGRVADVALVYKNGNLLIAECQLFRTTPDELEQRTRDYQAIEADVLWFLGKEADTPENRAWLRQVFGAVGRISFSYD